MFKKIIRKIAYNIYFIGYYEKKRKDQETVFPAEKDIYSDVASIGKNAKMEEGILHNRFLNKDLISIGNYSQIRGELEVSREYAQIKIGDYSYVGPGTKIYCSKSIFIGNRVLISHNVNIYDNNSHPLNAKDRHDDFKFIFENGYQNDIDIKAKEIIIEDDVWIGFNCIILKGVKIGANAIIGAGTIITENIPAGAVVVGNPARIIKYNNA